MSMSLFLAKSNFKIPPHQFSVQQRPIPMSMSLFLAKSNFKIPPHQFSVQKRPIPYTLRLRVRSSFENLEAVAETIMGASNLKIAVEAKAAEAGPMKTTTAKWDAVEIFVHCLEIVAFGFASVLSEKFLMKHWPKGLGKLCFVKGDIVRFHFGGGRIYEGMVKETGDLFRNTVLYNFEKKTVLSLSPEAIRSGSKIKENLGCYWRWEHRMCCEGLSMNQIRLLKVLVCMVLQKHPWTFEVQSYMEPGPVIDGVRQTQIHCYWSFAACNWKDYNRIKGELWEMIESFAHGNIGELIEVQVKDDKEQSSMGPDSGQ